MHGSAYDELIELKAQAPASTPHSDFRAVVPFLERVQNGLERHLKEIEDFAVAIQKLLLETTSRS